jgi:hypothetical protein
MLEAGWRYSAFESRELEYPYGLEASLLKRIEYLLLHTSPGRLMIATRS